LNYKWLAGGGLTHIDRAGEGLRFGEHSESVAEVGHVVGGSNFVGVLSSLTEERDSWVKFGILESSGAFVDGVEQTVEESGVGAASDGEFSGLKLIRSTYCNVRED
jgi:hypothetical protein